MADKRNTTAGPGGWDWNDGSYDWFAAKPRKQGDVVYVNTSMGGNLATHTEPGRGLLPNTLPEGTKLVYTGNRSPDAIQANDGKSYYYVEVVDPQGNKVWVAENWVGDPPSAPSPRPTPPQVSQYFGTDRPTVIGGPYPKQSKPPEGYPVNPIDLRYGPSGSDPFNFPVPAPAPAPIPIPQFNGTGRETVTQPRLFPTVSPSFGMDRPTVIAPNPYPAPLPIPQFNGTGRETVTQPSLRPISTAFGTDRPTVIAPNPYPAPLPVPQFNGVGRETVTQPSLRPISTAFGTDRPTFIPTNPYPAPLPVPQFNGTGREMVTQPLPVAAPTPVPVAPSYPDPLAWWAQLTPAQKVATVAVPAAVGGAMVLTKGGTISMPGSLTGIPMSGGAMGGSGSYLNMLTS